MGASTEEIEQVEGSNQQDFIDGQIPQEYNPLVRYSPFVRGALRIGGALVIGGTIVGSATAQEIAQAASTSVPGITSSCRIGPETLAEYYARVFSGVEGPVCYPASSNDVSGGDTEIAKAGAKAGGYDQWMLRGMHGPRKADGTY